MRITVLTGAGISAESGLATFRAGTGLWERHRIEDVATPGGFARDPALVHRFYNERRQKAAGAQPNAAHRALARLSRNHDVTLVTQNVDDLHERGGCADVIHMHGRLSRARCAACGACWDAPMTMTSEDGCPGCGARRTRPDIVWFGEIPCHMQRIWQALAHSDLFAAIGTSGNVYPAAGFVEIAANAGAETLELNLQPSDGTVFFDSHRHGPATEIVPAFVDEILGPA